MPYLRGHIAEEERGKHLALLLLVLQKRRNRDADVGSCDT